MQHLGSSSWRLQVSDSQLLDHAIFVRDAARLLAPRSSETPPSRGGDTPDLSAALPDLDRVRAGQQWFWWWHSLVAFELDTDDQQRAEDPKAWVRSRGYARGRVFDPPTFGSLQRWPELHGAAVATAEAAREALRRTTTHDRADVDWPLTRDVADAVIAERGVRPDQLDARVLVVEAPAAWSHLVRPGAVICSTGLSADQDTQRAVLRHAFVSGIDGT